jgi:hypothetical protein
VITKFNKKSLKRYEMTEDIRLPMQPRIVENSEHLNKIQNKQKQVRYLRRSDETIKPCTCDTVTLPLKRR